MIPRNGTLQVSTQQSNSMRSLLLTLLPNCGSSSDDHRQAGSVSESSRAQCDPHADFQIMQHSSASLRAADRLRGAINQLDGIVTRSHMTGSPSSGSSQLIVVKTDRSSSHPSAFDAAAMRLQLLSTLYHERSFLSTLGCLIRVKWVHFPGHACCNFVQLQSRRIKIAYVIFLAAYSC